MNPYRLSVYFNPQIMLGFRYEVDMKFLIFELPFLSIYINFRKEAKGTNISWIK